MDYRSSMYFGITVMNHVDMFSPAALWLLGLFQYVPRSCFFLGAARGAAHSHGPCSLSRFCLSDVIAYTLKDASAVTLNSIIIPGTGMYLRAACDSHPIQYEVRPRVLRTVRKLPHLILLEPRSRLGNKVLRM